MLRGQALFDEAGEGDVTWLTVNQILSKEQADSPDGSGR